MKLIMQENGFCKGIKIKRYPTWDETIYCLEEILGFNIDYQFDTKWMSPDEADDYAEEFNERKEEAHQAFINFIMGDCDWYGLCNAIYCEENNDAVTLGIFAKLIEYLNEKEIV